MSVWNQIIDTLAGELSDLPDVPTVTRVTFRLLTAALLGGILGFEREQQGKSAGIRTHMLVAIGSALFVLIPGQAGASVDDLSRVIQGLVAGIGFLGAGAILKRKSPDQVKGLTTAANIWLTAAIGVAVGMGREATAILSTVLALVILSALPPVIFWVQHRLGYAPLKKTVADKPNIPGDSHASHPGP